MTNDAAQPPPSPYVGPRPFSADDQLYGRGRELRDLRAQLIAERIVLLYSPSGAGKTSLIQAALAPALREEAFNVLPVIRVNRPPPDTAPGVNRFLYSTLLSLDAAQQLGPEQLASLDLAAYLRQYVLRTGSDEPVLIFDQFEEALTIDPGDTAAKERFFAQLGAALSLRQVWALFAMREDYLAALDPYLRLIPNRLGDRFRLDLLDAEAARQAIQGPAAAAGVTFAPEAAGKLADELRRSSAQSPDGTSVEMLGQYVEPVQLQVVCLRLWERRPAGRDTITLDDVDAVGDVNRALADYYVDQVGAVARRSGVAERAIREWFDKQLITTDGRRAQVMERPKRSAGLDNDAIALLVRAHLVRPEERRRTTWYELTHDRLIEPIRANNQAWFRANLSPLQVQAELWNERGRPDDLLLRDDTLRAAALWAAANQEHLLAHERDFLERSRGEQAQREREIWINRAVRWLLVVALAAAAIAFGLFLYARQQEQSAQEQRALAEDAARRAEEERNRALEQERIAQRAERIAFVRQLAATAIQEREEAPQKALLLAVEAVRRTEEGDSTASTAQEALREVLALAGGTPLSGHHDAILAVAFSPDGRWLATASADTTVRLWPVGAGPAEPRILRGHTGAVKALTFSPDGRWLVTGGEDDATLLWRVGGGEQPLAALSGSRLGIQAVAFSPNSRWFASGAFDGTIRLYGVDTPGYLVAELRGRGGAIRSLAFSPDSALLASGSNDGSIKLWRAAAPPQAVASLAGHTDSVLSLAFSPDGTQLASSSNDWNVRLWRLTPRPALLALLSGHKQPVVRVAFSPDGKLLASASFDRTARLWPTDGGDKPSINLSGHTGPLADLAFSPDGTLLATVADDGTARLWAPDTQTGTPQPWTPDAQVGTPVVLRGHNAPVIAVAFHPTAPLIATGSADATARIWNTAIPAAAPVLAGSHSSGVTRVVFSPDSGQLVTVGYDTSPLIWSTRAGRSLAPLDRRASTTSALAFSPDGRLLASGDADGQVLIWQAAAFDRPPITLSLGTSTLWALAFSPGGRWLAGANDNGTVWLWPVSTPGENPVLLPGPSQAVNALAFSPDGRSLAAASNDDSVYLWSLDPPGSGPRWIGQHGNDVLGLAFSPDSRLLASASGDATVRVWRVDDPDGGPIVLEGHTKPVYSVAFSPDGGQIATGGADNLVLLWDVGALTQLDTGVAPRPVARLEGHAREVSVVAYSPDGSRLATADYEGTTFLWDLRALEEAPAKLRGHKDAVVALAFSPDGYWLATGSADTKALLWPLEANTLVELACATAGRNLSVQEWQFHIGRGGEAYRSTCEQYPPEPSVFAAMIAQGRIESALAQYKASSSLFAQPEPPAAWLARLGAVVISTGQIDNALAAFERALAEDAGLALVDAGSFDAYCRYAAPDNVRLVIDACEEAARRAPDNGNYAYNRARARAMLGDYAGAIRDLTFFLEWGPGHPGFARKQILVEGWLAELRAGSSPFGSAPPAPTPSP